MPALTPTALSLVRGTTANLTAPITNLGTTGLTGYKLWFTLKHDASDSDAAAVCQKSTTAGNITILTVGNATTPGSILIQLAANDTASLPAYASLLYWDIKGLDTSGNLWPLGYGTLEIDGQQNITLATS